MAGAIPAGFGATAARMQPYPGYQIKLLDNAGKEVVGDQAGELYLAGEGVAQSLLDAAAGLPRAFRWWETARSTCSTPGRRNRDW